MQISQKIKHFYWIFDKRTYEIFKIVVFAIINLRNWKQADIANFWNKTLWQVQYFFWESSWDFKLLNKLRVKWIRNKVQSAQDKKSDILCFDSSIIAKNINSSFSWLANYFFSNKDKKIVNGFDLFWASIITKTWLKYVLDITLFYKKKKLNSKNKKNHSIVNEAWRKFMTKVFSQTKAWLVLIDSGFKWPYTCKWIYNIMKRHFLVRISKDQIFYDQNNNCFKIAKLLRKDSCINFRDWDLWVFKKVKLKSWINKKVDIPVNIIVFHKNWFRDPLILATSADVQDIYENMIKEVWDNSLKEKVEGGKNNIISKIKQEMNIYYAFVLLYKKRWSIEECFKELKSYIWFENFQVRSYDSIMKYLHIVLLVHTILYIILAIIYSNNKVFDLVYDYLKRKRNIKNKNHKITFMWLKLFIEMINQKSDDFWFDNPLNLFKIPISLKSGYCLCIQEVLGWI